MYHHVLFFLVAHYILRSAAQSNITIDDTDPKIIYTGQWITSAPSPLDFGPAHHLAEGDDALANFTFTGVAVYFMSPRWPYDVFTQIQLDSQPPVELNLSDPNQRTPGATGPETVKSGVVWGSGPLPNTTHTLLISKIRRPDRPYAIVDGLIYTTLLPPTSSSSIHSTASSTSPTRDIASATSATSASNTSSSSNHTLPIALGTVLGSIGLIAIAALLWFFCRGKKRPKSAAAWTIPGGSPEKESSPTAPLSPPTHPHQPMYPSSSYNTTTPNPSWSDSTLQMSTNTYTTPNTNPHQMQDFNPYIGYLPPPIPPLQNHPYAQQQYQPHQHQTFSSHYAPTTLSTITERSTPGTLGSTRTPLAASPASFPSADLSYYTPPQDPSHTARLSQSYNGDIPIPIPTSAYHHQHPHMYPSGSSGHLRSAGSSSSLGAAAAAAAAGGGGGAGVAGGGGGGGGGGGSGGSGSGSAGKPGKLGKEKNSMVAVNRTQDEEDGSGPPAYTPR